MTYGQAGAVCPQCGRADAVHSVSELASFAQSRLGQLGFGNQAAQGYQSPQGYPAQHDYQAQQDDQAQHGYQAQQDYQAQQGYQAPSGSPPPPGYPEPPPSSGFAAPSPSSGFPSPSPSPGFPVPPPPPPPPPPPDYDDSRPPAGYSGQGRPNRWSSSNRSTSSSSSNSDDSIEDAVAGLVMDAATKFVGRAISRRLKRAFDERVVPAMAARQEQMAGRQDGMLREQIAIAERYPDLRACLNDQVVFLAGGSRTVPLSNLAGGLTLAQADAVVTQLRNG